LGIDLLDPRWKGKILIRDPLASGTMRAVWAMIIERGLQQTHERPRVPVAARLDAQTKEYVLNGPAPRPEDRARGRVGDDLGPAGHSPQQARRAAAGYVFPKSGAVTRTQSPWCGTRATAQARAFVDTSGSVAAELAAPRSVPVAARDIPWTRCRRGRARSES